MRSSYAENQYNQLLSALTMLHRPKRILEIGILDALSLTAFADAAPNAEIVGYDLFSDFIGNHSDEKKIREMFVSRPNVSIRKGDFFKLQGEVGSGWDFIHIDVANCAAVYAHAFKHYLPLISPSGLLLLEGGSSARDAVQWMFRYDKKPIKPFLESCGLKYFTFQPFPSLTILYKENDGPH